MRDPAVRRVANLEGISFWTFEFFPPRALCSSLFYLLLWQVLEHDVAHDAEGDVDHLEVGLAQQREEPEGQAQVYQFVEQIWRLNVPVWRKCLR